MSAAPTVLDLRHRTCFICHTIAHFDQRQDANPDGWVHPCKCTLVAHQACLISMVDSLKGQQVARCPICRHPYEIEKTLYTSLALLRLGNVLSLTAGRFVLYGAGGVLCLYAGERFINMMRLYGTYSLKSLFGETLFDILLTDDVSNWSWANRVLIPILSLRVLIIQPFNLRHLLTFILCIPSEPPLPIRNQLVHNALRIDAGTVATFATPYDTFAPRWPPTRVQFGACLYLANLAYEVVMVRIPRLSSLLPGYSAMLLDVYSVSVVLRAWRRARNGGEDVREQVDAIMREDAPVRARRPPEPAPPPAQLEPEPEQQTATDMMLWTQLLVPSIAKGMGELLKRAARWRPAQQVLGIRAPMTGIGITLSADMLTDVNYWKRFTVWLWSEAVDPVWIRNTIGLGIFCIARDCVHAYYVRLKKKEIESRKIKSRNFEGLDPRELDLIHPVV